MPGEGILGENLEKTPTTLHQQLLLNNVGLLRRAAIVKCFKKIEVEQLTKCFSR